MDKLIALFFTVTVLMSACAPLRQETFEGIADYPATTTIEGEVSGTKKQTYSSEAYSNFLEGYIYEQGGELDKALPKYEEGLHHDQDSLFLLSRVATLQGKLGHINDAIETMNRLIVLAPRPSFALMLLAEMYFNIGDLRAARKNYKKTISKKSNFEPAYLKIGAVYTREGNYKRAEQTYKDILANINPLSRDALFQLVQIHSQKKEYAKAIGVLEDALAHNPRDLDILFKLSLLYKETKEYSKAIEKAKVVVAARPKDSRLHEYLGYLYEETKDYENAQREYEILTTMNPEQVEAYLHLGFVSAQKGDKSIESTILY